METDDQTYWNTQTIRLLKKWIITYTGYLCPLDYKLWEQWLCTSTIGNACPLVLETSMVCSSSNHYFLMGSVCSALVPYSNLKNSEGNPWQYTGFLSPTHIQLTSISPTSRLPVWLYSRDSLWLSFAYCNCSCDQRVNTISCLLLEFSRVEMKSGVFKIPK